MADPGNYTLNISHDCEDPQWDAFLAEKEGCLYEQSALWARVKSLYRWCPVRVVIRHGDRVVAGFQILKRSAAKFGAIGYVSKGPVFDHGYSDVVPLLVAKLKKTVKHERIHQVIVHPPKLEKSLLSQLEYAGFKPDSFVKMTRATLLIDLSQDIQDIFQQMKKDKRKEIRQGLRRGIKVRVGSEADIPRFYDLMTATCKRQGVAPNPSDVKFFQELWRVFSPLGYVQLFLAEHEKECIAGAWAICFGNTFRSWKVGWTGEFGRLKPNQVLKWELIKWAKGKGYAYFDFFGISPLAVTPPESKSIAPAAKIDSISKHKLRYGGKPHFYPPAYEYAYNPFVRFAYRNVFLKLSKCDKISKIVSR